MKLRRLDNASPDFAEQFAALLASTAEPDPAVFNAVTQILADVKQRGDPALLEYTNRFDQRDLQDVAELEVTQEELDAAVSAISDPLRTALQQAADRVRDYHQRQLLESWQYEDPHGNILGQKVSALDKVGVYVPGGKAAYPSSVLMNVIPAHVAGVSEIVMVVPTPKNKSNQAVFAAAAIAGVNRVFSVGGAQAIAALAYGTDLVPPVDKIVGPGNAFVAVAKKQVFGVVGIDMIAGPSEVLVISDGTGDPDWVAMDLMAQAEHDEDARAVLLCTNADFIAAVEHSMTTLLPDLERRAIITQSLAKNGLAIGVRNLQEAVALANQMAVEHLQLCVDDPEPLLLNIRHAGAIFVGHYAAEVLGDYCAGPNHVLPTARTARFSSPLGVYDFQKRSSLIVCSKNSAAVLANISIPLAQEEGLSAHRRAAEYRR